MVIFHSELLVYQRVEVSFSQVEFEPPNPSLASLEPAIAQKRR